ncbi:hypothetical protein PSA5_03065 [Pseudomonas syringae pv. actinidiae]|nr:hypothetical protein PSA5_03065 [Pseudomonas syringae pv. actinidiae]
MTALGTTMLATSNDMIARQNKSRDADSDKSVLMIAVATALALVISILAAWIITRQITTPLQETLESGGARCLRRPESQPAGRSQG